MTGRQVGSRAVVLGAGMAGLLAARVLAEAFTDVLVLDRAPLPAEPGARQADLLLGRGQQILDELFPGFTEELAATGLPIADLGTARHYVGDRPLRPAGTGVLCMPVDRTVLDRHLLARVRALSNVRLTDRTDILGLVGDDRVRGVRVRSRQPGSAAETVEADLVVDATGRNSAVPDRLAALGYDRPRTERIPVGLRLTTRQYRVPDGAIPGAAVVLDVAAGAGDARRALLLDLGGGRCVLTLAAGAGDRVPTDARGMLEWARALPAPDLHSALAGARPLGEAVTEDFEASLRRRYDQLDRLPERLLVVGDAACSINPVHHHGRTLAAQQALLLRQHLRHGMPQPVVFAKDVSAILDVPWNMAAGADLRLAGLDGACGEDVAVSAAFLDKVRAGATRDPVLTRALLRVTGLLDSPETLMTTDIVARAMGPGTPVATGPGTPMA